ncbi:MAG: hypothetical protein AMJ46_13970 [Latescibacteria bacterium DG_63]|nr:MAG: hypothetical protein AMJ46_13970 [Latescibacteria bacterium DG_63]
MLKDFFKKYSWDNLFEPGQVKLEVGKYIGSFEHCDEAMKCEPVLVPPTWHKEDYHRGVAKVWAAAARELREAKNIFVVGYSLPPSDQFFRYLLALGTAGPYPFRRFWVFNPDSSVEKRFREILGLGALDRFRFFASQFGESIGYLRDTLREGRI